MLTQQELTDVYKKFDDERIIRIARFESKSLRHIALPILENEIKDRNLSTELLDWIKLERNFFKGVELFALKSKIKNSTCSHCKTKKQAIFGFHIHHCSVWNDPDDMNVILCESCGKKLRTESYKIAATMGWISKTGFLRVPYYLISETIDRFQFEKISNQIIEDFIFENTGLSRYHGIDNIEKILDLHNKNQMQPQEITFTSLFDFI